jgi:hypothetical protein
MFKEYNILPSYSQYIYSRLLFVIKNKDTFKSNTVVHNINTRHSSDLHPPLVNLTELQKGVYYSRIKIFNSLPVSIKNSFHNINKFKSDLKVFLLAGSFYSLEKYFNWFSNKDLGSIYNIKRFLNSNYFN